MFTSLETVPTRNSITCADNSSYLVKGVGQIALAATNDNAFTLKDALYVPRIKKNLLSIFALTRVDLVIKFVDDRCTVHDLSDGDTIVASGSLCRGLYKLNSYEQDVKDVACTIFDMQAVLNAKLWHVHFGHQNFASLL